jgi:hypothetical protein
MKKALFVAVLAAGAAMGYAMRKELHRYVTIKRSATNPQVVGQSITPQGNMRALGSSAEERDRDR